jgi:hypothetical protein
MVGVLSAGSVSTAAYSSRYRRIASADHYVRLYPLTASGRADTRTVVDLTSVISPSARLMRQ